MEIKYLKWLKVMDSILWIKLELFQLVKLYKISIKLLIVVNSLFKLLAFVQFERGYFFRYSLQRKR